MMIEQLYGSKVEETYNGLCKTLYEKWVPSFVQNQYSIGHFMGTDKDTVVAFCSLFEGENKVLHIGNFQSHNVENSVNKLFTSIEEFGKQQGYTKLIGPMHGSTFYPYRFTESMTSPFSSEYIHKYYYPYLFTANNFKIEESYYTTISSVNEINSPKLLDDLFPNLVRVDSIHESQFLNDVYQFVIENFKYNPLYRAIDKSEFDKLYRPIIDNFVFPFCQIIYDQDQIAGLFFAFPDQLKPNTLVVKTLARNLDEKYKGLTAVMCDYFVNQAFDHGFTHQIHAYFHENSLSQYVTQKYGGEKYKSHHIYAKEL